MTDDYKERLSAWGARYEYRLKDILERFECYEREMKERERIARAINLLGAEGNAEDII